jgi:DNA gyrase/topoisomerase IV subunit B
MLDINFVSSETRVAMEKYCFEFEQKYELDMHSIEMNILKKARSGENTYIFVFDKESFRFTEEMLRRYLSYKGFGVSDVKVRFEASIPSGSVDGIEVKWPNWITKLSFVNH